MASFEKVFEKGHQFKGLKLENHIGTNKCYINVNVNGLLNIPVIHQLVLAESENVLLTSLKELVTSKKPIEDASLLRDTVSVSRPEYNTFAQQCAAQFLECLVSEQ